MNAGREKKSGVEKKMLSSVMELYGKRAVSFRKVEKGIINTSFFVRDTRGKWYVLRIYKPGNHNDAEIRRELRFMNFLRRHRIPVPAVMNNLKGSPLTITRDRTGKLMRAIVMERVEGHHLHPKESSLIGQFAKLQARMHICSLRFGSMGNKADSFNFLVRWLQKESILSKRRLKETSFFGEFHEAVENVLSEIKRNKKAILRLPNGEVHLDYDSDNVIVSKNKIVGILDFDDIKKEPLSLDIANSLWWWLFFSTPSAYTKIVRGYFSGYRKYKAITDMERRYLPLFMRLRNMTLGALLFVNSPSVFNAEGVKKTLAFERFWRNAVI